jgi:hypothetical protein
MGFLGFAPEALTRGKPFSFQIIHLRQPLHLMDKKVIFSVRAWSCLNIKIEKGRGRFSPRLHPR